MISLLKKRARKGKGEVSSNWERGCCLLLVG